MNKKHLSLLGIVFACMIIVSFVFVNLKNNETTLAESIVETKKGNQKIEELFTMVSQELEKENFGDIGMTFTSKERLITVQVKDQDYIDKNEVKIKTLVNEVVHELKLDAIKIQFKSLDSYNSISEKDKKLNDLTNEISEIASKLLRDKGYVYTAVIDPSSPNPFIKIQIINETNEKINKVNDELQKRIKKAIFSKTKMNFTVTFLGQSGDEKREQKWQPIFTTISEEVDKKFEEYRGFAYSFHPKPLQIIIKTNIQKSKGFQISDKKVKKIGEYVNEIIKLKREELSVEAVPYEIIIRSKDNKRIN
ncbi:hypothetical protein [Viridibacillus arvi]|uniref:hypothetical protein n=1 Tax=Viridibacillus arvi TaxID=263475 RepID=UPI003D084AFB